MSTFFPLSFPELYLLIPLIGTAFILFGNDKIAKNIALTFSSLLVIISAASLFYVKEGIHNPMNSVSYYWLEYIGSFLVLRLEGTAVLLCLLISLVIVSSILITPKDSKKQKIYFTLILLLQTGLYGVFMSYDAIAFYIFWEVVLIPLYFLCSFWGGEKAVQPTLKFFIYTFLGSLFMLMAIVYIYSKNEQYLFRWESLRTVVLNPTEQNILFILFMIAFAIKMPIFPFHTWQPKLYTTAPISITLILSAVMVKMGVVGVMRWVLPFFPLAVNDIGIYVMIIAIIGIVYASFIAIKQNDLKSIIAYSSIAHIGLMAATMFTLNNIAMEGVIIQMFNHGINIMGLWMLVYVIQKKYNTTNIKELGGIITQDSFIGFTFLVLAFANIALPLTNSFVGEFPMLLGLYKKHYMLGVFGGLTVILSAVYMLRVVDAILFGSTEKLVITNFNMSNKLKTFFIMILIIVFSVGIYPKPIFSIVQRSLIFMK